MKRSVLALSLFFLVLIPFLAGCENKKLEEDNAALKTQVESLNKEKQSLQANLDSLKKENQVLASERDTLKKQTDELTKEVEELKAKQAKKPVKSGKKK